MLTQLTVLRFTLYFICSNSLTFHCLSKKIISSELTETTSGAGLWLHFPPLAPHALCLNNTSELLLKVLSKHPLEWWKITVLRKSRMLEDFCGNFEEISINTFIKEQNLAKPCPSWALVNLTIHSEVGIYLFHHDLGSWLSLAKVQPWGWTFAHYLWLCNRYLLSTHIQYLFWTSFFKNKKSVKTTTGYIKTHNC